MSSVLASPPEATLTVDRAHEARFRLAMDQEFFTLSGVGVVVTGTVLSGSVHVEDLWELISPSGLTARVRSLHTQNKPAGMGQAGDRCALNLVGPACLRRRSAAAIWLSIPNCMRRPTASMQVYVCCRMWRSQLASGFRYDCITLQPRLGRGSCCSVMIQFDRVNRPRCNWCWIGRSPPRCRTAMSSGMSRRGTRWAGGGSLICVRQPGGVVALSGRRNVRPWPLPIRRLRLRPYSTRHRLPGISRSSRVIGP